MLDFLFFIFFVIFFIFVFLQPFFLGAGGKKFKKYFRFYMIFSCFFLLISFLGCLFFDFLEPYIVFSVFKLWFRAFFVVVFLISFCVIYNSLRYYFFSDFKE